MFVSLDFSLNTSEAIKKEGVKISKTEYAVFVYYKLESRYKKSSKFGSKSKKKSDFKWNTSHILWSIVTFLLFNFASKLLVFANLYFLTTSGYRKKFVHSKNWSVISTLITAQKRVVSTLKSVCLSMKTTL
jgi:hypothetical protein